MLWFVFFDYTRWMRQHEYLEKLNIQAVLHASANEDEYIKELFIQHQKVHICYPKRCHGDDTFFYVYFLLINYVILNKYKYIIFIFVFFIYPSNAFCVSI